MPLGLVSVLEQSRKQEPAATAGISTPLDRRIVGTLDNSILLADEDEVHDDELALMAVAARAAKTAVNNFIIS